MPSGGTIRIFVSLNKWFLEPALREAGSLSAAARLLRASNKSACRGTESSVLEGMHGDLARAYSGGTGGENRGAQIVSGV